jgi:hypothetical protein
MRGAFWLASVHLKLRREMTAIASAAAAWRRQRQLLTRQLPLHSLSVFLTH